MSLFILKCIDNTDEEENKKRTNATLDHVRELINCKLIVY